MERLVSGIRYVGVDKVLISIFSELTTTLGSEFMSLPDFRTDIAQMPSKVPPVAASAFGDIASWFVQFVASKTRIRGDFEIGRRRCAREQHGSRRSE